MSNAWPRQAAGSSFRSPIRTAAASRSSRDKSRPSRCRSSRTSRITTRGHRRACDRRCESRKGLQASFGSVSRARGKGLPNLGGLVQVAVRLHHIGRNRSGAGMAIGAFMRCDRGDTLTDHHTLFLLQSPGAPRFNHAAFEVADFDDLMRGHMYLKRAKRSAAWGVGRHILGSQIFDYWKDPWGHELEHWTDGDLFTAADGSNKSTLKELLGVQWGPQHPMMAGATP